MSVFAGQHFCVTGKFSMKRKDLEELLQQHGATISGTITGKVTALLCEEPGTTKYVQAQNKGLPIHDEAWVHSQITSGGSKKTKVEPEKEEKKSAKGRKKKQEEEEPEEEEPKKPAARGRKKKQEEEESKEEPEPTKKPRKKRAKEEVEEEEEEEAEEEEEEEEEAQPKKTGKKADDEAPAPKKKKNTNRKVDEACRLTGAVVHEDWDCMLNQTNVAQNNNKYYRIQVLNAGGKFYCWTHWGRVGEPGQNALKGPTTLDGAIREFKSKFQDKTRNAWDNRSSFKPVSGKYTLLEMDADADDEDDINAALESLGSAKGGNAKVQPSALDPRVQSLVKLIFDHDMFKQAMKTLEIDVKKMPLGKLSKDQIKKGYAVLEQIEHVLKRTGGGNITALTSEFYTLVPHDFGRMRPPLINDLETLRRKYDLLQVLEDIETAQALVSGRGKAGSGPMKHPLDQNYELLKADLEALDTSDGEYKIIEQYVKATKGHRKITIQDVFRLRRHGEEKRFDEHKNLGNRKLLWHGTNVAVVVAIVSGGLRIMPHSGGRVGKGIYFASENSKSASYVRCAGKTGIMFLSEVALGKEHHITADDSTLVAAPPGYDSIVALGRTEPDPKKNTTIDIDGNEVVVPQGEPLPTKWSSSSFSQSEYLIYKESQNRLRYLLRLNFD